MPQLSQYWHDLVRDEEIKYEHNDYISLADGINIEYSQDVISLRSLAINYYWSDPSAWLILGDEITLDDSWINFQECGIQVYKIHQPNPNITNKTQLTQESMIGYNINVCRDTDEYGKQYWHKSYTTPRYATIATMALLIQEFGSDIKIYEGSGPIAAEVLLTPSCIEQINGFVAACWVPDIKSARKT